MRFEFPYQSGRLAVTAANAVSWLPLESRLMGSLDFNFTYQGENFTKMEMWVQRGEGEVLTDAFVMFWLEFVSPNKRIGPNYEVYNLLPETSGYHNLVHYEPLTAEQRTIYVEDVSDEVYNFLVDGLGAIALPTVDPHPEVNNDRIYMMTGKKIYFSENSTFDVNPFIVCGKRIVAERREYETFAAGSARKLYFIDENGNEIFAGSADPMDDWTWSYAIKTAHVIDGSTPPYDYSIRMRAISGVWSIFAGAPIEAESEFTVYSAKFEDAYQCRQGVELEMTFYPATETKNSNAWVTLVKDGTYLHYHEKYEEAELFNLEWLKNIDFGPTALIKESQYQAFRHYFRYVGPTSISDHFIGSDGEYKPVAPVYKCMYGEKVRL